MQGWAMTSLPWSSPTRSLRSLCLAAMVRERGNSKKRQRIDSSFLGNLDARKSMELVTVCPKVPKELPYVTVICHHKSSLSSLKGHGDQGRLPVTGERQLLHQSSKRARKTIWKTAGQYASFQSLGKSLSRSHWLPGSWSRRWWLGTKGK